MIGRLINRWQIVNALADEGELWLTTTAATRPCDGRSADGRPSGAPISYGPTQAVSKESALTTRQPSHSRL